MALPELESRRSWQARMVLTLVLAAMAVSCSGTAPASRRSGSTTPSTGAAAGGVAWIDQPRPTPDSAHLAGSLPDCQAAQLRGRVFPSGPGGGTVEYQAQLINLGTTTCALLGYPSSLAGLDPSGQTLPLSLAQVPAGAYVPDEPALLAPGAAAEVAFLSTDGCSAAGGALPQFVGLRIGVAGGTVNAPDAVSLTVGPPSIQFPCGAIGASPFARWFEAEGDVTLPGMQALEVSLHLPRSVDLTQSSLEYSVDLINPTRSAITLKPCPTYTESFSVGSIRGHKLAPPAVTTATYLLNCRANSIVAPHSDDYFEMKLPLPRGLTPGLEQPTLSWRLNVLLGTGPEATSVCPDCQP